MAHMSKLCILLIVIAHLRTLILSYIHTMTLPQAEPDEEYTHLKYHITETPIILH